MRGIGCPRAISAVARLPQRGLRGSVLLAPNFSARSPYSAAAGRGGVGSPPLAASAHGRGSGRGRNALGFPGESEAEATGHSRQDESDHGRLEEWRDEAQMQGGAVGGGAGRGRGIIYPPRPEMERQESVSFVDLDRPGRGRGAAAASSPHEAGRGRGIPLGSNAASSELQPGTANGPRSGLPSIDREDSAQRSEVDGARIEQGPSQPSQSAVEKLLARLVSREPKVSSPQPSAPAEKPRLPFRMPFARPSSAAEQQQQVRAPKAIFQGQTSLPLGAQGRGRVQTDAVTIPAIGSAPEAVQPLPRSVDPSVESANQEGSPPRSADRMTDRRELSPPRRFENSAARALRETSRGAGVPRVQLSVEEARARAISVLEKGIQENFEAEGERRRVAGMERFSDAAEFFTDRFKRTPGEPASQTPRLRTERPTSGARRSNRPGRHGRQRSTEDSTVAESPAAIQLTAEQEAQIVRIQEEDTFKERLHNWFLAQFEPEFAMEEFGRNPDIEEPLVLSLEEYLQSLKPMYMGETAELSEEQKWEEAVKTSLANAPNLEKLVEAYAGRGRITARQQVEGLETISQKLSPNVSPAVAAFTQRALNTLQNNPGLKFRHKEQLMRNIVYGFSSS